MKIEEMLKLKEVIRKHKPLLDAIKEEKSRIEGQGYEFHSVYINSDPPLILLLFVGDEEGKHMMIHFNEGEVNAGEKDENLKINYEVGDDWKILFVFIAGELTKEIAQKVVGE